MAGSRRSQARRGAAPRKVVRRDVRLAAGGDAFEEVKALLETLHARAEQALRSDRSRLLEALSHLGAVRTQVLFRAVRTTTPGGGTLARASQVSHDLLSRLIGPALNGEARALSSIGAQLKSQERAERVALAKLRAAGADFAALLACMRGFAGER